MAKIVYENINKDSNMKVGTVPLSSCDCPPKRVVKKVWENPDTIKNWVNNRTEELQKEIQVVYQEVENIKSGFAGKKLVGKQAVKIDNSDSSTTYVSVAIDPSSAILSQTDDGILATLGVSFDPSTHVLKLVGKDGVVVSSCSIPTSGGGDVSVNAPYIKEVKKVVEEGNVFVKFIYENDHEVKTDINEFVDIQEDALGNITINSHEIKISELLSKNDASIFLTHNDVSAFITKEDASAYLTHNDISTFITEADASSMFQEKGDYLTEHQKLKTINGYDLVGEGNISIVQVQSDWNQTDATAVDFIKSKPTIPSKTSDLENDANYISKVKTINGQSIIGEGNIVIQGSGVQVQTDWNQNDSTAIDYIKNKPNVISKVKTINGQSIEGEGNIEIQGGSSVQSDWNQTNTAAADYIKNKPTVPSKTSDLYNDSGFLTTHQSIKTINNQVVTGEGNLVLNTLSDEQMSKLIQLLALNISFSPTTEIFSIGGKSYNLGKGGGDLTSRYWVGTINTETRSTFPTLTDDYLIENATEKDVTTLTDGVDVYDVTTNMIYLVIPENITIQKILMGEPPMVTTWQNQEWKDTTIWKQQHTDIVKDEITYHVYGYRAVDMQQTTPTKFQLYLQKQN